MIETSRTKLLITLIDPHEGMRFALTTLLNAEPDMEVAGADATGELGCCTALERQPDVVVSETELEDRSGFEVADRLARLQNNTRVLFYSSVSPVPDVYIDQTLRSRAAGLVLKIDSLASLILAVRRVAAGATFFSESLRDRLAVNPVSGQLQASAEGRITSLSDRQIEVLRNLALGLSVRDVARKMQVSVKSIDSHKYRIMQALGIHDRVDLAHYAIREGLIRV